MADPPEIIGQPPLLGIPPKGIPPTDPKYRDLAARGKLPRDVFNVLSFGASADGNIDDTKALQRAIDAASKASGGTVYLPRGAYKVTTQIALKANVGLRGDGDETTINWQGGNASVDGALFRVFGTGAGAVALTANAVEGGTSLTVAAGAEAGFAADDFVQICSNEVFATQDGAGKVGEIQQVASTASGTINLHDPLFDGYLTADGAQINKLNFVEGVTLEHFRVTGRLGAGADEQMLADLGYCRSVRIHNVHSVNVGRSVFALSHCLDVSIIGCVVDHTSPASSGYGIHVAGASQFISVVGCHFNEARHAITAGILASIGGVPRCVTFVGNTVRNAADAGVHSHASEYWTIGNNILVGCASGVGARGTGWAVNGNEILRCVGGISLKNYTDDRPGSYAVVGNIIRHVNANAILVEPVASASTNNHGIVVANNVVHSLGTTTAAIEVGDTTSAMSTVSITGNSVWISANARAFLVTNCDMVSIAGNNANQPAGVQVRPLFHFVDLDYFSVIGNNGHVSTDVAAHMEFDNCDHGSITGNALVNGTDGINLDANCSNIAIVGNSLISMSANAINNSGATSKIAHNIGDATHNE